MIIYILINIAIVLLILGFDLYRHRFRQLKFSSILLSVLINSMIDILRLINSILLRCLPSRYL